MEKETSKVGGLLSVLIIAVVTIVVWYQFFGYAIIKPKLTNIENELFGEAQAEPVLLDIQSAEEAYDAILNKSTKEFIGNYTIDDNFLSWFASKYGVETLEAIASYAELSDAEIWYDMTGASIHVLWNNYCQETGYEIVSTQDTYSRDAQSSYETVLDFTGDFSLADGTGVGEFYKENVKSDVTDFFSPELVSELHRADILTINNETTYTTRGEALEGKPYTFRTNPDYTSQLNVLGCDVAGLANNHVYDFGEIGLLDTLDNLEANSIPYAGAGKNIDEADDPIYYIVNGRKIAIVAATQIERYYNYTKEATSTSAGVLKTKDPARYVASIREAKKNADYVICFVHWGTEGINHQAADQKALADAFIAAGADAIIGGHTHCLQGIEVKDGVPIFYSLGNFYFTEQTELPHEYDTAIAQLVIKKDGSIESRLIPCQFKDGYLTMLTDGEDYRRILDDVQSYSSGIRIDNDGRIISDK
ncbi:MAG: CapA family protein [Lachnospiraceae bacterium]|nr:CapA family protein [Lachnospiraceae bacterium]